MGVLAYGSVASLSTATVLGLYLVLSGESTRSCTERREEEVDEADGSLRRFSSGQLFLWVALKLVRGKLCAPSTSSPQLAYLPRDCVAGQRFPRFASRTPWT